MSLKISALEGDEDVKAERKEAGMSEHWKPIDTAPMDGTPVWAICMRAQNPTARISYHGLGWQVISPPEKFSPPGPHRWWPTHWQPLEPPHA